MRYLLTFGNHGYEVSMNILATSALATGSVDKVIFWNDDKLRKTPFFKANRKILTQQRGAGYWLWKPYIILEELKKLKKGDFLIYSDSKMLARQNFDVLYDLCAREKGILLFRNLPQTIECWCKRDALVLMNADKPEIYKSFDFAAMMSVWQKTPEAVGFLEEWLKFCEDERILTDMDNTQGKPNYPYFVDHRHDQAVFSVVAVQKGIRGHRPPNQYGKRYRKCEAFKDDAYGELFQAHFSLNAIARNFKLFPLVVKFYLKKWLNRNV